MAYSVDWDETAPDGATVLASDIDTHIQNVKIAVRERLEDIFPDWDDDGVDPKPPTGILASGPTAEKPATPTFDGQLFYDETVGILYIGTDIGGTPTWVDVAGAGSTNKSRVVVKLTAAQSLVDNVGAYVSWAATLDESPSTMWDVGAPTNLVVPSTGLYAISLNTALAGTGGNGYFCRIDVTGAASFSAGNESGDGAYCSVTTILPLTAADIVKAWAYQNSGGPIDLGPTNTYMSLVRLA